MADANIHDVVVVGGGIGGIYAAHLFADHGLSVVGVEGGSNFGGVWHHNGYPGSRVDTDSVDYCYHFSPDLFNKWYWDERYAAQPELIQYLNYAADFCDVRRLFRFNSWLQEARWSSADNRWHLATDQGERFSAQFLVMCTGNLSVPRRPDLPGLDRFKGAWVQTSRWPQEEVPLIGRRVGIIGTGSTGVQAVPVVAREAEQLFVFQRHAHYAVPAQNRPAVLGLQEAIGRDLLAERERLFTEPLGPREMSIWPPQPVDRFSPREREAILERQWEIGGHGMSYLFLDQAIDKSVNDVVAKFARNKIRERVGDPALAEKMCPEYPFGTHRLALDIGYYEAFKQDNVAFVDVKQDPIVEITESGVRTTASHYELDLLILAVGFRAFHGAFDAAGVRNERGQLVGDVWARGPKTLLGVTVPGFPNFFTPTGAGSPSVASHMFLMNEFHLEWIADCLAYMRQKGHSVIEPTEAAADAWGQTVASYAERLLRRQEDIYMVHVNADDGSRIFIPLAGGMHEYVPKARAVAARGYDGFVFS